MLFFFFKQKTAYEMRISDWSSDVCSSDLLSRYLEGGPLLERAGVLFSHVQGKTLPPSASAHRKELAGRPWEAMGVSMVLHPRNLYIPTAHMNVSLFVAHAAPDSGDDDVYRSEEHKSELQSIMRISSAAYCLIKK